MVLGFCFYFVILTLIKPTWEKSMYTVIAWEAKPYIFLDEKGNISGLFPIVLNTYAGPCFDKKSKNFDSFVEYEPLYKNWSDFKAAFDAGRKQTNVFWAPFFHPKYQHGHKDAHGRPMLSYLINTREQASVVVHAALINFEHRLHAAAYNSLLILLIIVLLVINFGLLVGAIERWYGNFPDVPSGIWWAFATITTVGYGDRVPCTFLGRFFAIMWALCGMFIYTALLSFLIENITGVFELEDKTLSVFTDSFEADHLNKQVTFNATNYRHVFLAVRDRLVDAALVNPDIVNAHIEELHANNLQVVQHVPADLNAYWLTTQGSITLTEEYKEFWKCTSVLDEARALEKSNYAGLPAEQTFILITIADLPKSIFFLTVTGLVVLVLVCLIVYYAVKGTRKCSNFYQIC